MTEKQHRPISPDRLHHQSEFKRNSWHVSVPSGISLADLEKPELWRHATKFSENDLIECVSEDGSFDALFRVVATGHAFIVLRKLYAWQREGAMNASVTVEADGLSGIEFLPDRGWVAFKRDGSEIGEFETEEAAVAALKEVA